MGLTAKVYAQIHARQTGSADLGTPSFNTEALAILATEFGSGTSENQVDKMFSDSRTINASSSETLDLAGSLSDAFGATITFATVKAILIKANAGNTNNVVVGNAGANDFVGPFGAATHTIAVKPGGVFLITAPETGWTVTAGTGDALKIANSGAGTGVTYSIIILGTSA